MKAMGMDPITVYKVGSRSESTPTSHYHHHYHLHKPRKRGERRMRKVVLRSSSRRSTVVASFKKWSTVPNALEWSI